MKSLFLSLTLKQKCLFAQHRSWPESQDTHLKVTLQLFEVSAGNLSSLDKKLTCTQIFLEAQGKEVCKKLCSSWIYLLRISELGWACLAQLKTEGIYCWCPSSLPSSAGFPCEIQEFKKKKPKTISFGVFLMTSCSVFSSMNSLLEGPGI